MNTLSIFNPSFTSSLFDAFDRSLPEYERTSFTPLVDVTENKDSYILDMELPGFTNKDVDINLKNRILTISSIEDKAQETKNVDKDNATKTISKGSVSKETVANESESEFSEKPIYLLKERRNISFSRSFTLPEDIDVDKVFAKFENGLLTITIQRRPETQARKIQIEVA